MRRVSIVVTCDACDEEIEEEVEGDSAVRFTARTVEKEMDLCDDCLYGTFLQEARPVSNRKKRKKPTGEFTCHCGKSFGTQRGLTAHQTRQAHD
jgi:hypothetical protein